MAIRAMIEARNLTKYYGSFLAIEKVNFVIKKGEILGFLGPNGAGKTTTMRILTGFIPPTSGEALVAGYDLVGQSIEARAHIGYLPETVPLYTEMTVKEYLSFMGRLRGMNSGQVRERLGYVIEACRLEDYYDTFIGKLSKGFRQRVGIAQAIIHEPDVLILDEPTVGIDPIQVVETRQLIKDLAGGHTVILSTHILPEVSMLCDRVLIIHEGKIVAEDTPDDLGTKLAGVDRVEAEVEGPRSQILEVLKKIRGIIDVTSRPAGKNRNVYRIQAKQGLDLRPTIARTIVNNNWALLNIQLLSMSLEEIFLKLTTEEDLRT